GQARAQRKLRMTDERERGCGSAALHHRASRNAKTCVGTFIHARFRLFLHMATYRQIAFTGTRLGSQPSSCGLVKCRQSWPFCLCEIAVVVFRWPFCDSTRAFALRGAITARPSAPLKAATSARTQQSRQSAN